MDTWFADAKTWLSGLVEDGQDVANTVTNTVSNASDTYRDVSQSVDAFKQSTLNSNEQDTAAAWWSSGSKGGQKIALIVGGAVVVGLVVYLVARK